MTNPPASDKQAINEAISSWFEPRSSLPVISETDYGGTSPEWAWCWSNHDGWQPLDYFTSEAASARLLEAMQAKGNVNLHGANGWGCEAYRVVETDNSVVSIGSGGVQHSQDRKTAILLAFCKSAGIEVTHVD